MHGQMSTNEEIKGSYTIWGKVFLEVFGSVDTEYLEKYRFQCGKTETLSSLSVPLAVQSFLF